MEQPTDERIDLVAPRWSSSFWARWGRLLRPDPVSDILQVIECGVDLILFGETAPLLSSDFAGGETRHRPVPDDPFGDPPGAVERCPFAEVAVDLQRMTLKIVNDEVAHRNGADMVDPGRLDWLAENIAYQMMHDGEASK